MTETAAAQLAERVRAAVPWPVSVEREARYFIVVVAAPPGSCSLRDEEDWQLLQRRIASAE